MLPTVCQLRNHASDDTFLDHLVDDCSCTCGADTENTIHFFFQCPLYSNIRHHIVSVYNLLGYINTYVLTHGVTESNPLNEIILYHINSYIKDSKRFSIYS